MSVHDRDESGDVPLVGSISDPPVDVSDIVLLDDRRFAYASITWNGSTDGAPLLCDPVTGLVAYPSFERHLVSQLDEVIPLGLHLAIGDVDDLREHVLVRRAADPTSFGHLAGNECMRRLGMITSSWAAGKLADWPFSLCGTFGGDEVIVAGAGVPYERFVELVRELSSRLHDDAPRPCSFAVGTFHDVALPAAAPSCYRALVSTVDAALFELKAALRAKGVAPCGDLVDVGRVNVAELLELHRSMGLEERDA